LQRAASPLPEREVSSLSSPFQGGWAGNDDFSIALGYTKKPLDIDT
jgi:hypothetical protein